MAKSIKYITTTNLHKMNTVKLTNLYVRIFGVSPATTETHVFAGTEFQVAISMSIVRQHMTLRIAVWMDEQIVMGISALAGVTYDKEQAGFDAFNSLYAGFSANINKLIEEKSMVDVAAVSGWRFDQAWKLINGGLKNDEIAQIMNSSNVKAKIGYKSIKGFTVVEHPNVSDFVEVITSRPVTAKNIANVRYGQVTDNMKKKAVKKAKKAKKSIEPTNNYPKQDIPEGYYKDLGLIVYE